MKNLLKTTSILLGFGLIFAVFTLTSSPAVSVTVPAATSAKTSSATNTKQTKTAENPDSIPEKNLYDITHMEHKGFKYSIVKFFIAMGGVAFSAAAIWLGLKLYKKFLLRTNSNADKINYEKTLESPKDFKEAINQFLDKTDK